MVVVWINTDAQTSLKLLINGEMVSDIDVNLKQICLFIPRLRE